MKNGFFHIITTKNNIIFWSKKICLSRETSQIYWLLHYIYTYTYTYTYIYIHIYIIPFNQRKKHNNLSFCILRILWVFKIRVSNLLSGLQYVFYNVWNIQDIEINLIIYIFIQNFIGHIYIYIMKLAVNVFFFNFVVWLAKAKINAISSMCCSHWQICPVVDFNTMSQLSVLDDLFFWFVRKMKSTAHEWFWSVACQPSATHEFSSIYMW